MSPDTVAPPMRLACLLCRQNIGDADETRDHFEILHPDYLRDVLDFTGPASRDCQFCGTPIATSTEFITHVNETAESCRRCGDCGEPISDPPVASHYGARHRRFLYLSYAVMVAAILTVLAPWAAFLITLFHVLDGWWLAIPWTLTTGTYFLPAHFFERPILWALTTTARAGLFG